MNVDGEKPPKVGKGTSDRGINARQLHLVVSVNIDRVVVVTADGWDEVVELFIFRVVCIVIFILVADGFVQGKAQTGNVCRFLGDRDLAFSVDDDKVVFFVCKWGVVVEDNRHRCMCVGLGWLVGCICVIELYMHPPMLTKHTIHDEAKPKSRKNLCFIYEKTRLDQLDNMIIERFREYPLGPKRNLELLESSITPQQSEINNRLWISVHPDIRFALANHHMSHLPNVTSI